jgi:hypothetical protein
LNEKICIKKEVSSPNLYVPELVQFMGENVEVTITITSKTQKIKTFQNSIVYEDICDDLFYHTLNSHSYNDDCSFEMT